MLKKERFNAKQNTAMGQIPRSIERISSLKKRKKTKKNKKKTKKERRKKDREKRGDKKE